MRLIKLSYKSPEWELSNFELGKVNLVVGRNATGKSRTLDIINSLAVTIIEKGAFHIKGAWRVDFINARQQNVKFEFNISSLKNKLIAAERISIDNEEVLIRRNSEENVLLKNYITGEKDIVYPPNGKLTLHVNRDVRKYPYLEEIIDWAERFYGIEFANMQNYDIGYSYGLLALGEISSLFNALNKEEKTLVIAKINSIGYDITTISVKEFLKDTVSYTLYIKERNIKEKIPDHKLSQGMFRAFATIIYIEYLISQKKPALIIIDDLCEGLDYERAKKLGQYVFERCENSEIQLIATSNDSFLMDVIDIQYWNILQRNGSKVTSLNSNTHQAAFRKFRLTGLSNFDLFSSDFLQQQQL